MVNYIESEIVQLSIHHIGSKIEDEGITTTAQSLPSLDPSLEQILLSYFFDGFKTPEFYNFTFSNGDVIMNPVYNFVTNIFNDPSSLHEQSVHIAKHLYERSSHPNIKSGELIVSHIDQVLVDDEMVEAIAIFKSETKDTFLQINENDGSFEVSTDFGINPKKIDKGCIILNTEEENGFKLCIIDKSNNGKDAQYWINDFLYIKPRSDEYHQTKNQIDLTKSFIKERLEPIHEIDKTIEADILNRSHKFFKNNEDFKADAYEEKVFKDERTIEEFKAYKEDFQDERNVTVQDEFKISPDAVKKQAKVFKSVLKLDKNFHIYIHGDRSLIQKGVDNEGKKFYQVYYDEEK